MDGGPTPADGGSRGIGEPIAPATPVLIPCPGGWTEVDLDGFVTCEPPSGTGCAEGSYRFPTGSECVRVGGTCPAGDFPDELPEAERVLYVRPGAITGTGDRARPFSSIADAMRSSLPGTLIVLAEGDYEESVDIYAGVTVLGACATGTRIVPRTPALFGSAVRLAEPNAALVNVTIAPADAAGVEVRKSARLEGIVVENADGAGVAALGGDIVGRDVVVRGTTDVGGADYGIGIGVSRGASVDLSHVWIEGCAGSALRTDGADSQLYIEGLMAVGNGRSTDAPRAVGVQDGALVELRQSVIEGNFGAAGSVLGEGAILRASDVLFRGFDEPPDGRRRPLGITVNEDGRLEATRVRLDLHRAAGIGVLGGGSAMLEDVVVTSLEFGTALAMGLGGELEGRRVHIADAEGSGLLANEGELRLEDLRIARTAPDAVGSAIALGLGGGVSATLKRVRVEESSSAAVLVTGAGTDATFEDVAVVDTASRTDGTFGRGLEVQAGARVRVFDGLFERNREATIMALQESTLELSSVRVLDSQVRDCASSTCTEAPGGTGISIFDGSTADVSRFLIDSAALCGVQIARGGALDLRDGEIANAVVGACVQVEGYDLSRVTDGTRYSDNGVNVDLADHAVPAPAAPLPSF